MTKCFILQTSIFIDTEPGWRLMRRSVFIKTRTFIYLLHLPESITAHRAGGEAALASSHRLAQSRVLKWWWATAKTLTFTDYHSSLSLSPSVFFLPALYFSLCKHNNCQWISLFSPTGWAACAPWWSHPSADHSGRCQVTHSIWSGMVITGWEVCSLAV